MYKIFFVNKVLFQKINKRLKNKGDHSKKEKTSVFLMNKKNKNQQFKIFHDCLHLIDQSELYLTISKVFFRTNLKESIVLINKQTVE